MAASRALLLSLSLGLLGLAAAPLAGCGGGDDDDDDDDLVAGIPAECNPLGGAGCITPWPSALYEVEDTASATGMKLALAEGAWPANAEGVELDPAPYNRRDGFSPGAQLFTVFPEGVDDANLVGWDDPAASLTDASPTVIIDMTDGGRVAHFAELDANALDPEDQALYIRPVARLAGGHRYAVAVRTSLKAAGGGELATPPGFVAIRDGVATSHALLERTRPRYEAIFAALEAEGIDRDELVVAWDFTTASDASITADALAARDAALAAMGELAANMTYVVTGDAPVDDGALIKRKITGRFTAPGLLTDEDDGGLRRDGDGVPVVQGTMEVPFVALVPACATPEAPVPIIIFGHGFFGDISEAGGSYMRRIAAELCMVVIGTEWVGMRIDDTGLALGSLNNANRVETFGERIIQGIVAYMTATQLARGAFADELLVEGDPATSLVDPSRIYFYGISQGHILGSTFFAYDPFLTRGVFHVGGSNWGILFERSTNWNQFRLPLLGAYPGALNMVIMQSLLQMALDPIDPEHVAQHVLADRFPGTPEKQILHQMAVGDCQVTNLASEHQARTIGLPVLAPALYTPYGMTAEEGPLANGFVIYDEQAEPPPHDSNLLNEEDNDTHGTVRKRQAVIDQIQHFFEQGEIIHTCGDGIPCDCASGACGDLE
jgi:hypothetical protein